MIIRQYYKNQPYIIALTINVLLEDRQLCLDAGMNNFISKLITISGLNLAISEYIKLKVDDYR